MRFVSDGQRAAEKQGVSMNAGTLQYDPGLVPRHKIEVSVSDLTAAGFGRTAVTPVVRAYGTFAGVKKGLGVLTSFKGKK